MLDYTVHSIYKEADWLESQEDLERVISEVCGDIPEDASDIQMTITITGNYKTPKTLEQRIASEKWWEEHLEKNLQETSAKLAQQRELIKTLEAQL